MQNARAALVYLGRKVEVDRLDPGQLGVLKVNAARGEARGLGALRVVRRVDEGVEIDGDPVTDERGVVQWGRASHLPWGVGKYRYPLI